MVNKLIETGNNVNDKFKLVEYIKANPVITGLVIVTGVLVIGFVILSVKVRKNKKRK